MYVGLSSVATVATSTSLGVWDWGLETRLLALHLYPQQNNFRSGDGGGALYSIGFEEETLKS
jgi:hypothetical protein